MRLGIDFGTAYTRMAALTADGLVYSGSAWPGPIPGILACCPATGQIYFGTEANEVDRNEVLVWPNFKLDLWQNPETVIGNLDFEKIMAAYLAFLKQQIPLGSGQAIEAVTLSMPAYCSINTRNRLYNALHQVFADAAISLLPEPLSILLGYQALHPQQELAGDILLIDFGDGRVSFSIMSLVSNRRELILETQLEMDQGIELDSFVHAVLGPHAQALGLSGKEGWRFNCIILAGGASHTPEVLPQIKALFPDVPLFQGQPDQPYTAVGNCLWATSELQLFTICPFKFYIARKNPQAEEGYELEPIPFDTINLELEITRTYRIFSLPVNSPYNLAKNPGDVEIKIYAADEAPGRSPETLPPRELVLYWEQADYNGAEVVHIHYDLASSQLFVNFTDNLPASPEVELFHAWKARQLAQALWLSDYKHVDKDLLKALHKQLQSNSGESAYSNQLMTTYYKLLCVLQILNP